MTIAAKIIADSINPDGKRLTTFVCTYHRFILAEVNTHRQLSRNSASSRAVPISKMINAVISNLAEPVFWGANQKGMQSKVELSKSRQKVAKLVWRAASLGACGAAWLMSKLGVHKQIANRLLEPFSWTTSIITATEWGNFFNLRCHPDAQPEFQQLAFAMLEQYAIGSPAKKEWGEWHIPFGDKYLDDIGIAEQVKVCTARSARVSYFNFEGDIDYKKDFKLHDDLLISGHVSPSEHSAQAEPGNWGNFLGGWKQYRKTLAGENRSQFNAADLLRSRNKTS